MIVPRTYEEWKNCIVVECGIPLTLDYVQARLQVLQNPTAHHTQRFVKQWGSDHLARTIAWFSKAEKELVTQSADPGN